MRRIKKVSVITITFNQRKYIGKALESILSQKTNFEFELIVADDCSTDGTDKIIREYTEKYPNIVKPILRSKNIGAWNNFVDALSNADGEYIALCEGDDYWTDLNKLQRQVDFLDKHPDYTICFHPVRVIFENGQEKDTIFPAETTGFTTKKLLQENYIQTNSVMYRKKSDYNDIAPSMMPGDWYLHLYHARFGKVGFINTIMSAYRRHSAGIWWGSQSSSLTFWQKHAQDHINFFEEIRELYKEHGKKYQEIIDDREARLLGENINIWKVSNESIEGNKFACELLSRNPSTTIKLLQRNQRTINSLSARNVILTTRAYTLEQDNTQKYEQLQGVLNSRSYKIGHAVTEPYRLLKGASFGRRRTDKKLNNSYGVFDPSYSDGSKLAVIVHLYYLDLWPEIRDRLKNIKEPFDLYASVVDRSEVAIGKVSLYHKKTNVISVPNRGRDVLPFLVILKQIEALGQYDYILKLHTKKSKHRTDGSSWFCEILDELLPEHNQGIFNTLEKSDTGLIGPSEQVVSLSRYLGDNSTQMNNLVTRMFGRKKAADVMKSLDRNPFFGGTMFWARTDYFDSLLKVGLKPSDFPAEEGQVDGTIAHVVERVIGKTMHRLTNRKMYAVDSDGSIGELEDRPYTDPYKHV